MIFELLLHILAQKPLAERLFIVYGCFLVIPAVYCIVRAFWLKSRIALFIIVGTSFYLVGSIISFSLDSLNIADNTQITKIPIFYEYIGTLLECICFSIGLSYRLLVTQMETNRQLHENQRLSDKLLHVRNQIAAEMHDDLGSGLSTIRVMSEMAKVGIEQPEKKRQIERVAEQANDLIERMATIIWAMNTRNDTVENLIHYLYTYTMDFLETIGIDCHFSIPKLPPSVSNEVIIGEKRREIFLTVKEALNNIVKHAKATAVTITIVLKNNVLEISIRDNGIGLNSEAPYDLFTAATNTSALPKKKKGGNGLKNMHERMESIGGQLGVFSEKNKGTTLVLSIPTNKS